MMMSNVRNILVFLVLCLSSILARKNDLCSAFCGGDNASSTNSIERFAVGPPGKMGPPGAPGSVSQCNCSRLESKYHEQFNQMNQLLDNLKQKVNKSQQAITSCLEIKRSLTNAETGVYTIVDLNRLEYKVYCDMSSNGGGWTLVASIHENNIGEGSSGKCTVGDKWSSEQGNDPQRPEGDGNWQNRNIFGHLSAATNDDYKNPAYFELQAKDVMVWQVPNNTPLRQYSQAAYLKYRTTDEFLTKYGGNLYNLYNDHYPIKSGVYPFPNGSGPAIPIVFDLGDKGSLLQHFPPNAQTHIEAGYLQFRAISTFQDAYAFCPGVRNKPTFEYPSYSCLGSTGKNAHIYYCGDLASLRGATDAIGVGWSADQEILSSTFFIFYR